MKKTFIITGANRGLGKAFVDVLVKNENHYVISISRSQSEDQETNASSNFYFLKTDLSENNLVKKIRILKDLITNQDLYFINNASIIEPITKIEHLDEVSINKTISVNIKSTILLTKYLLGHFNKHTLTFVNISSGAANRAISNWSLYCASKAFIQMFFNVAENEYKQHRFFNINPGVMDTSMQKSLRESDFPDVEKFKDLQKEGKLRSPIDVAQEILKTININL